MQPEESDVTVYFKSIGGVKSYTCFSRLTPEQQECMDYMNANYEDVTSRRCRELYLRDLILSVEGFEDEDSDEPVTESSFSQYRFYDIFTHSRSYAVKFDLLCMCVKTGVVLVKRPKLFLKTMSIVTASHEVEALPDHVVRYEEMIAQDEEERIASFTLKKDWVSKVPHYLREPTEKQ